MICSLGDFQGPPCSNEVPLCEIEGVIYKAPYDQSNLHLYTSSVASHPNVILTKEVHHHTPRTYSNRVFLPVTDTLSHRLQNAWYERGLVQVLELLADPDEHRFALGHVLAKTALYGHRLFLKGKSYLNTKNTGVCKVKLYSGIGPVVCIAWHPHSAKIAIATREDSVSIYSSNCQLNPVLKAKSQRNIMCIAWRPLSGCEIAVGCSEGTFLWSLDPNSVICRPSVSSAILLQTEGHRNISAVAWSPNGDCLATGSAEDNTMYLWEVEAKMYVALRRVTGGGISLLSWSPDNTKLLAATVSKTFRIWETEWWESEMWNTIGGDVVAAVWSPPEHDTLLFATRTEPYLYAMPSASRTNVFQMRGNDARTATHVCADFEKVLLPSGDVLGGEVLCMAWDNRGRHLAVVFKDCDLVPVFVTTHMPNFRLAPGFLVKGKPGETPSTICFQNDFKEGANLTIAWSDGRIQYFPIIYKLPDEMMTADITSLGQTDRTMQFFSFNSP